MLLKDKYGILYGDAPTQEVNILSLVRCLCSWCTIQQKIPRTGTTLEDLKIENKGQSETLENMEGMFTKLQIDGIGPMKQGTDVYEKLVEELNDQSAILMEIKGNLSRKAGNING